MHIRAATMDDMPVLIELWAAAGLKFRPGNVAAELTAVLARDPELVLLAADEQGLAAAVGQVQDHGGPAPVADREGYHVEVPANVPDGASCAYTRPSGSHVLAVDFRQPVRDCPGADHSCPRHREISVQGFYLLR